MLIADGGGGYGGTDWNSKDVRYMWAAVADQETDSHFDVVSGWRQTAELTLTHLGQVRMYRDNLASVWPPSKSAASAAYLGRLDSLIADLQATHDAASANYTAFSTVTLTLSLARNKLQPLLEQYEANEKANLAWQAKREAEAANPTEPPKFSVPPVSSAQQERLNSQARAIMYDLSSTVISGQAALQKPKPYNPAGAGEAVNGDQAGRAETDTFAVPPIIPPPGSGGSTGATPLTSIGNSSASHAGPTPSSGAAPSHSSAVVGGTVGSGPVLGSAGPGTVTPGGLNVTPSPPVSSSSLQTTTPGLISNFAPPVANTGLIIPGGQLPQKPLEGPSARSNLGSGPGGRVSPPSGVVGASPGSGIIGQMPSRAVGPREGNTVSRVNPVGGVIGQPGGPAGRGGVAAGRAPSGPGTLSLAGHLGRNPTGRDSAINENHWDPDNPWATKEGVEPVLLPPPDPGPIDPGPAIGHAR
ncbi:hypothetical protein AB0M36_10885 [Actinoplanes sp. NPDC051346]|uniref:hypothetical protein n=1 Tax=Actinoplanes sp. NPDC051346 TaxID=3155048 RepID=UPI00341B1B4E